MAKKREPVTESKQKKQLSIAKEKNVKPLKKRMTLRQLSKYKDLMSAVSNARNDSEKTAIMESLQDNQFNAICNCVRDIVYDTGAFKGRLSNDEFANLKELVGPYRKGLQRFANDELSVKCKKKMLRKTQKGGSAILGAIIGSLIPMALHAVENWIMPKK